MKIIYLKNFNNNKRGDVREANDGFVRNYLLPQGIAVIATVDNLNKIKKELANKTKKNIDFNEAQKLIKIINGRKLEIVSKANESGKLYAAVNAEEILSALAKQGIKTQGIKIILDSPIKELGSYKIKVDLGQRIMAEINLIVRV